MLLYNVNRAEELIDLNQEFAVTEHKVRTIDMRMCMYIYIYIYTCIHVYMYRYMYKLMYAS